MRENVDGLVALCCVINIRISVGAARCDITMHLAIRPFETFSLTRTDKMLYLHDGQFIDINCRTIQGLDVQESTGLIEGKQPNLGLGLLRVEGSTW